MINMDMIGKMRDSTVIIGGVGTSPVFEPILDSLSIDTGLKFEYDKAGYGPSDHASFYAENIPVLFFLHRGTMKISTICLKMIGKK